MEGRSRLRGFDVGELGAITHVVMPTAKVTVLLNVAGIVVEDVDGERFGGEVATLTGLRDRPLRVSSACFRGVQLDLDLFTAARLFGPALRDLTERVVSLEDVVGPFGRELTERLHGSIGDVEARPGAADPPSPRRCVRAGTPGRCGMAGVAAQRRRGSCSPSWSMRSSPFSRAHDGSDSRSSLSRTTPSTANDECCSATLTAHWSMSPLPLPRWPPSTGEQRHGSDRPRGSSSERYDAAFCCRARFSPVRHSPPPEPGESGR